jgi:hypothetical protein
MASLPDGFWKKGMICNFRGGNPIYKILDNIDGHCTIEEIGNQTEPITVDARDLSWPKPEVILLWEILKTVRNS